LTIDKATLKYRPLDKGLLVVLEEFKSRLNALIALENARYPSPTTAYDKIRAPIIGTGGMGAQGPSGAAGPQGAQGPNASYDADYKCLLVTV